MKAIIIGATGLVGGELLKQLCEDKNCNEIVAFVRRVVPVRHSKLRQVIVDFEKIDQQFSLVTGNVLFVCLGTTIKKAGSRSNFRQVDFVYNLAVARLAAANGVGQLVLVSSVGADSQSSIFYLKTKGAKRGYIENRQTISDTEKMERIRVFELPNNGRGNSLTTILNLGSGIKPDD